MITLNEATQIMDNLATDDRWGGYGYLAGRFRAFEDPEITTEKVAEVDAFVIQSILENYPTDPDALFQFVNSRPGRHFADNAFETDHTNSHNQSCLDWFYDQYKNGQWA